MRHLILALLLVGATAPMARADVLHLKSGQTIEGKIVFEDAKTYTVEIRKASGLKARMKVNKIDVAKIVKQKRTSFEELIAAYESKRTAAEKAGTADAWFALGQWCTTNKLRPEAKKAYLQVVALVPSHAAARAALGQELIGGKWMTRAEATQFRDREMRLKGYLKYEGKWYTPEAFAALVKLKENKTRREIADLKLAQDKLIKRLFELEKRSQQLVAVITTMQQQHTADRSEIARLSRRITERSAAWDRITGLLNRRVSTLESQVRTLQSQQRR